MTATLYDEFPDPGRKNPVRIPINKMMLDSKVITAAVTAEPESCETDSKLLIRRPVKITLRLKSAKPMVNRKLNWHNEPEGIQVVSHYCVIWNPTLGHLGAWDTEDVRLDSISADGSTVECRSTKLGTFAVISEIYEPPTVPDDPDWLLPAKMVGFGISMTLLLAYSIAVILSKYLWEMFHIIGLNLAGALLLANGFMILSDQDFIREDLHLCFLAGLGISVFYVATAFLVLAIVVAIFIATTKGIIGGYTNFYLSMAWGVAFLHTGLEVYSYFNEMGNDPRCMIGWDTSLKYFFSIPAVGLPIFCMIVMLVVMCNLHTSAMRKKSLLEELRSIAHGVTLLTIFYGVTWALYPLAYMEGTWLMYPYAYLDFIDWELPNVNPYFQVLNSFLGLVVFLGIGLFSKRFITVITRNVEKRKDQLVKAVS